MVSESERCNRGLAPHAPRSIVYERPPRSLQRTRAGGCARDFDLGGGLQPIGFNTSQRYMYRYDSYPKGCFNITHCGANPLGAKSGARDFDRGRVSTLR